MPNNQLEPHKLTKPIQLLGAWLLGLTIIDGGFLGAAVAIGSGQWERSALVIAAIVNVPIFLLALFVLQTKFRAELQEDSYYSEYISKKTALAIELGKNERAGIGQEFPSTPVVDHVSSAPSEASASLDWSTWKIGLNEHRDDFLAIREALLQQGIPVAIMFGVGKPPKEWVISISSHMGFDHVIALLRVLVTFSFDGFSRWEPVEEAGETEDVYIGSYGDRNYVRFTPQLQDLLAKPIDEVVFNYYCSKNTETH